MKEGSEEGGALGRGQEEMRRAGLVARKEELEEERGMIKARLDMLEEVKREALRRKKDQREESECVVEEEYQNVFSTGEFDIGKITFVKHCIDTCHAAPIRQRKEEEVVREQLRKAQEQEEQREKVEELLGEYWDDTSRKTLVKRRIDTGDTALIRQRKEDEVKEQARRALKEKQREEEEEAKDQSEGKEE